jgi:hypothetical protein
MARLSAKNMNGQKHTAGGELNDCMQQEVSNFHQLQAITVVSNHL